MGRTSIDVTARHIAVGVEGGALTAELDGRQFAAALESYVHGDEQARLRARLFSALTGLGFVHGNARACLALQR